MVEVIKYILLAIYAVVCLFLISLVLRQNKDDRGASGTIVGSSSVDNFYEKNKGRTREGRLKKWTAMSGVAFFVLTLALGIIYVM